MASPQFGKKLKLEEMKIFGQWGPKEESGVALKNVIYKVCMWSGLNVCEASTYDNMT